ncbi:MAG: CPBP family intramembrane metalloprotease [Haliscomenobacter sp.]|nr:CPBP family intramembrane metalloprotease [Haliscomenobacter sp.]MBK8878659.1 CPBP family intramembrane metalloprotease [Haliscomenobacter sp.]
MKNSVRTTFPILFPIGLTLIYTGALLWLGKYAKAHLPGFIQGNPYLDQHAVYQIGALVLVLAVLGLTFALRPGSFKHYFRIGNLGAPASRLAWLGIKEGERWTSVGWSMLVIISVVTGIFMGLKLGQETPSWSRLFSWIPWILLFAAMNAFAEEVIFRFNLIVLLTGRQSAQAIYLLSAILFGLPHYAGMPNGLLGVLMAGLLGFVLAKSVVETKGMFWAWFIHFIQDVLIIGSMALLAGRP